MVKIWTPFPYRARVVRVPEVGELYLDHKGDVVKNETPTSFIFPIAQVEYSTLEELLKVGLQGRFKDTDDSDWTSEYDLQEVRHIEIYSETGHHDVVEYVDEDGDHWDQFEPTKILSNVTVELPRGLEAVRYGKAEEGETYVISDNAALHNGPCSYDAIIVSQPGHPPTFEDLGKRCRFWSEDGKIIEGDLHGVELVEGVPLYNPEEDYLLYENCEVIE